MQLNWKSIFILCNIFLLVCPAYPQLHFNFEDGKLNGWQQSTAGRWEASPLEPISGTYSLHHVFDSPIADNDQISFIYPQNINYNDTIQWSFRIRHSYNPSSANNWAFFLASDNSASNMCPDGKICAIAVGVNYTGSDDLLKIWKIENGNATVVLQSTLNWETSVGDSSALVNIERNPDGNWILRLSANGTFENLKTVGSALITYVPETYYFGIYYKYSSSQDQKLWIDDINIDGTFINDTVKPYIDTAIVSKYEIDLQFNKPVDFSSINKNNFIIEPTSEIPDSILKIDDNHIKLIYTEKFISGVWFMFNVSGIADLKGNIMLPYSKQLVYYVSTAYDVLITEIMADPEPAVGLPPYEYLELYNRSDYPININKWKLTVRSYYMTFPDFIIPSKGYLILCSDLAKSSFDKFGPTLSYSNFTYLLTNTGTSVMLSDSNNYTISFVNYSDSWYDDDYKKSGGWSLEMIDPMNPCSGKENWSPSIDKSGGTPGRQNSVWDTNPDNTSPEFYNIRVPNDSEIILHFSEPLSFEIDPSSFFLDSGIGYPDSIDFPIDDFSSIILNFNKKLEAGKKYELHVKKALCDCAGNTLADDLIIPVTIPQQPDSFDVVINEVLFNSFPYGSEFIEIYNRSNKVIDAGSIIIATIDTSSGNIKADVPLAKPGFLLYPKTYLAITTNIDGIKKFYTLKDKKAIIEQPDFPSLPDDHGIIVLQTTSNKIIDRFEYNVNMHFALLSSDEGVSLERLQADWPTQQSSNWHSASQTAGYATPGYANSQLAIETNNEEIVTIVPDVFTPNNDGRDDYTIIGIKPDSPGYTATVNIFNSSGIIMRHLVAKQYLGSNNSFTWDGTSDDHKLEPPGIYIVYALLLSDKGKTREFKKACVLGK